MSQAFRNSFEDLYGQLRSLPANRRGEILAGDLVVSPRPAVAHALSATRITGDVGSHFGRQGGGRPGGWLILAEPELHLTTDQTHVLSPDIAGWKRETLPVLPRTSFLTVPPDWVCEILSPSTARHDRNVKARIYHDSGVTWRWLVDPDARTVEAYRREGAFWVLLRTWEDQEKARIEPFDAVELDLSAWWEDIAPPVLEP